METETKNNVLVTTEVTKEYDFKLTEAEKDLKIAELSAHETEELKEKADFEEKQQAHKTAMLKHKNNFRRALSILKAKKETRAVICTMVKDMTEATVKFYFEGTLMEERPMTSDERQLEMGPVLVKGRTQTPNSIEGTLTESQNDITTAIREETNPRTKNSSVDGPTGAPEDTL